MNAPAKPPALPTGGAVMAIVPQTFEELQRIANTVIAGRLAPGNLVKTPKPSENATTVQAQNIAAVSSVLMAGAELGLPPMVALRSFTVINGRPALYADGNVAVIRKARDIDGARVCKSMSRGFTLVPDNEGKMSDESFGWCESERADTGETYREEFSIADAKIAGLWDEAPTVTRETWGEERGQKVKREVPNDAPWHRYWKKMLMWRATGYCLRWLYADILGGMVDEYEAREIAGMVDVTPSSYQPSARNDSPPEPPTIDMDDGEAIEAPPAADQVGEDNHTSSPPEPPSGEDEGQGAIDPGQFLTELKAELENWHDEQGIEEAFDLADVQVALAGNDAAIAKAFALKNMALDRVFRAARLEKGIAEATAVLKKTPADVPPEPPADDDGQEEMPFPGDTPLPNTRTPK